MGRRTLPPRRRVSFRRAGGWARRVLARVLAGAGRKLGPRVARVRRVRLCWELFQCGRLQVGGRGEGEGPRSATRVIIWPQPDPPQPPPGLWLRAESGVSLWVLSWGPPGRGCLQAGPGPAGRPGVGGAPGRAWCEGEGLSLRDRDRLWGEALGWCAEEAGRPGLRGAGGLVPAWARPGPGPRPGGCLGRRSAAMAVPGGFCSWSLREVRRAEGKRQEAGKETKRHFQNLPGH